MPGNPSNILHKCCHENDKGRLIISDKSQRYITHRIQNYMKNMKFYKKKQLYNFNQNHNYRRIINRTTRGRVTHSKCLRTSTCHTAKAATTCGFRQNIAASKLFSNSSSKITEHIRQFIAEVPRIEKRVIPRKLILQDPLKVSGRRMGMNIKIGPRPDPGHLERGSEALSLFRQCFRLVHVLSTPEDSKLHITGGRYSQPSRKIAKWTARVVCEIAVFHYVERLVSGGQ